MNIPAYTSPTLCIGRTYDATNSSAGIDIYPPNIPTKKTNVNRFKFDYKVVKNNSDAKNLLDISGELSLKVKAGLVRVEGSGRYLTDSSSQEGTTEVLVVLKCITVSETMDGLVKVADEVASGQVKQGLGTHFVRGVTYGGELVASLSIKSSVASKTRDIQGSAAGEVKGGAADVKLKDQLKSLASQCTDLSDIAINYYATELPEKLPTSLDELVKLIEQFPSRLEKINNGQGIPLQFELLPINTAIQTTEPPHHYKLSIAIEEDLEQYYDDLRSAKAQIDKYEESREDDDDDDDDDDDVLDFSEEITKVMCQFRNAISLMNSTSGKDKTDACLEAYHKALDGRKLAGKFCKKWRKILRRKKPKVPTTLLKLPPGKGLTVVLVGKTGNGKSSAGNQILGKDVFGVSDRARSSTLSCQTATRSHEREITVIDTPGIIDTSSVRKMKVGTSYRPGYRKEQHRILTELAKMFVLAPRGFHAILLLVKFGTRFTPDDAEALIFLQTFLSEEATNYMILLLTHGDQAEHNARKGDVPVDKYVHNWIEEMDDWVREFVREKIGGRVVLMNGLLDPDKEPEAHKKQLCKLIEEIDKMNKGKNPFVQSELTEDAINDRVDDALDECGFSVVDLGTLESKLKDYDRRLEVEGLPEDEELDLKARYDKVVETLKVFNERVKKVVENIEKKKGGCYPGSAVFVDARFRRRKVESLEIGEEVQVVTNNEIRSEPVITFIHRQPDVMQEFLKITTLWKNKILKITEDHLLFVEKEGQLSAIPARDVNIGDTVYVRGVQGAVERDAVQNISRVYEKGVYAPVTLSGTILVNDVHTSCYFDVLSHEWSHRAMGVARAVHHASPWMLQWLSGVGEKDGFPGWCRLAHKMLTWFD